MKKYPVPASQALIGVLLAFVLVACGEQSMQSAAPAAAPPPPKVSVVIAEASDVPRVAELPGRTSPFLIAEVRPQVTGLIKQRAFQEGSVVNAGDLLYEIEPARYQAAYESARAGLERAKAARVSAKLKADRYAGLARVDAVSKQAKDDSVAELQLAEADIAAAQAAIESAEIDLAFTQLTAPISGLIGRSGVTRGALVTANQAAPLATVQQLDPIYVDLTQSSAQLLKLRRELQSGAVRPSGADGMAVSLLLEDGTVFGETGRLEFSEVTVDAATGSVTLRAVFPNPDGVLLPGMYVRARIEEGVIPSAILVPHAALGRDPRGNATVMVVNSDDVVELRLVKADRSIGDKWVITEGLSADERIIVEGLQYVRPGAKVTVTEADVTTDVSGKQG